MDCWIRGGRFVCHSRYYTPCIMVTHARGGGNPNGSSIYSVFGIYLHSISRKEPTPWRDPPEMCTWSRRPTKRTDPCGTWATTGCSTAHSHLECAYLIINRRGGVAGGGSPGHYRCQLSGRCDACRLVVSLSDAGPCGGSGEDEGPAGVIVGAAPVLTRLLP